MEQLEDWSRFVHDEGPTFPEKKFIVFPPNCITVSNVVTQTRLSHSFCGNDVLRAYPFCRRNVKNWRAILMRTDHPGGTSWIYDMGMMIITGNDSPRASRYVADRYVDLLRRLPGNHDLTITSFRVINLTTTFALRGALDVDAYRARACPELRYLPDGFVGARKELPRTGALLTLFMHNGTALGKNDLPSMCMDVRDELVKLDPYLVETGTNEERDLNERVKKRRRREV